MLICVSSDIITIGLDHFNDQSSSLALARKTSDTDVVSLFGRAQSLLTLSAIVLCVALSHSPPLTWLITAVFVTPALLWDTPLFARRVKAKKEEKKTNSPSIAKNGFIIKRVPGMKAVFIGIIRGWVYHRKCSEHCLDNVLAGVEHLRSCILFFRRLCPKKAEASRMASSRQLRSLRGQPLIVPVML